jgi:hypothetical protein
MRLYKDRWYLVERTPGISGFQRWKRVERTIERPRPSNRLAIVREYQFTGVQVQIMDGHLPGYRPVMTDREAVVRFPDCGFYLGEYDR